MKLVTATQMKELEQLAINEFGIEGLLLMENAARGFVDVLESEFGQMTDQKIAVYCGKGNNGGDGFAISRHLHNRKARVTVIANFDPAELMGDAKKNFDIITRMGIPVISGSKESRQQFDFIVDALHGTGFHGEINTQTKKLIRKMNQSSAPVISVDMPSGAEVESGKVASDCVRATATITFGMAKVGQFLFPAKEFVGNLFITDISLPRELLLGFPATYHTLDAGLYEKLPQRPENSHKGSFGKVLVLAGSPGMHGACVMAATAALKSGAGMVTAAVPKTVAEIVSHHFVEIMTLALPAEGDGLSKSAPDMVAEKLKTQNALLVGCGLGAAEGTKKALLSIVSACKQPLVIDADGINLLKGNIHVIKDRKIPAVLTPHPLEFSRISGYSMEEIKEHKTLLAERFAKEFGVVLALKGADTVIAHPDGQVFICPTSNSGLATAGSGDVLSGIIASFLAQGQSPEVAANLGVYVHSLAGLSARNRIGAYGMTADDVISEIPGVLRK